MKLEVEMKPRKVVPELQYTQNLPSADEDMVQAVDDTFELVNTALRQLTKLSLQTRHEQDTNAKILHGQVETAMRDLVDYFDEYQKTEEL